MNEYLYRLIGRLLVYIGIIILLLPFIALYSTILIFSSCLLFGFIITFSGATILSKFRETKPFLTKSGEMIHSGRVWNKGSESGLYLTSCERVVSINQESEETAHVGYRLVAAKRATCRDCILSEVKTIMDKTTNRRRHFAG